MLSERALHILNILEEQNGQPVTAKKLAAIIGISERSIKTYINEVSDFCEQINCTLIRKPGVGFVFCTSKDAKKKIEAERELHSEFISRSFRLSYIVYILLTGWNSYTMALFADELGVSKNIISEDLDHIEPSLTAFGLHLNRIAGKGISLTGDEFTKRKAFRKFCQIGVEQCLVEKTYDSRLSIKEEKTYLANYGKNFEIAVSVIQKAEKGKSLWYTDYSFKMLVEYLAIQIMRIGQGKYLPDGFLAENIGSLYTDFGFTEIIENLLQEEYQMELLEEEKEYIYLVFIAGEFQNYILPDGTEYSTLEKHAVGEICQELACYVEDVLSVELSDTEVLQNNLRHFLPSSFIRAKYGFEIRNPFLQDVKKMYLGIFVLSFALYRYYKKYVDSVPNEQELSFLALFIGGALLRSKKHIRAVIIGNCGTLIANIIAARLEEKMGDIEVIAVLPSEERVKLKHLDYDVVLSMKQEVGRVDGENTIPITSMITEQDVKTINSAYFERIGLVNESRSLMLKLLFTNELMMYIDEKYTKEEIIKSICHRMHEKKYVTDTYLEDVLCREAICSTSLGRGIAIPHGGNLTVGKPGISVVRLKHGIEWGDGEVDIIFMLALNFENIELTRDFFSEFAKLIESDLNMEKLRRCQSVKEMKTVLEDILNGK